MEDAVLAGADILMQRMAREAKPARLVRSRLRKIRGWSTEVTFDGGRRAVFSGVPRDALGLDGEPAKTQVFTAGWTVGTPGDPQWRRVDVPEVEPPPEPLADLDPYLVAHYYRRARGPWR